MRTLPIAFLAVAALGMSAPVAAVRHQGGAATSMSQNEQATTALRARIDTTQARVAKARSSRAITSARAKTLQGQVTRTRQSMTRLARQQGFVSAAELASYNRTLGAIDLELDRRGVERSYGNDMLPAHH